MSPDVISVIRLDLCSLILVKEWNNNMIAKEKKKNQNSDTRSHQVLTVLCQHHKWGCWKGHLKTLLDRQKENSCNLLGMLLQDVKVHTHEPNRFFLTY